MTRPATRTALARTGVVVALSACSLLSVGVVTAGAAAASAPVASTPTASAPAAVLSVVPVASDAVYRSVMLADNLGRKLK